MEIFDVTQTNPSILLGDNLGVNYSQEHVLPHHSGHNSDGHTRHRHCSDSAQILNKENVFTRQTSLDQSMFTGKVYKTPK